MKYADFIILQSLAIVSAKLSADARRSDPSDGNNSGGTPGGTRPSESAFIIGQIVSYVVCK
jgi:hypothetical protein